MVATAAAPAGADEAAPDRDRVAVAVTYQVDPENREIRGSARVTVRVDPAAVRVLASVSLVLPEVVPASVSATRSGVPVAVTPGATGDDFAVFTLGLGRGVGPGEVAEVDLRFTITATTSLREPAATRINPAYVSFPARGLGDEGLGSVKVEWPVFFDGRWIGVEGTPVEVGFAATLEQPGVGREFVAVFEMRNDDRLERSTIEIPGTAAGAELLSWDGDVFWRFGIGPRLVQLVPALVELVGEPWPLEGPLVVRETNAGVVHGYDGSFVRTADGGGEIEMGTVLDRRILAHELAHAWFDERFAPWLAEGLAEEYARQVAGVSGFGAVAATDPAAIALADWEPRAGEPETDRFAYAAAASLLRRQADEIGDDGLRSAVGGLLAGASAYGADVPPIDGLADWQRVLDAFEQAGSATIQEELVTWVLATAPSDVLDERARARADLVAFEERSGEWGVPLAIRLAMARWDFATAQEALAAASALLDQRDELAAASAAAGVEVPGAAAASFATDPRAAATTLAAQERGLDAVRAADEAVAADRSWVASIGLWGADLEEHRGRVAAAYEAGEHDVAVAEAASLTATAGAAGSLGARRLAGAIATLATVGLVGFLFAVRRVRRRAAAG